MRTPYVTIYSALGARRYIEALFPLNDRLRPVAVFPSEILDNEQQDTDLGRPRGLGSDSPSRVMCKGRLDVRSVLGQGRVWSVRIVRRVVVGIV